MTTKPPPLIIGSEAWKADLAQLEAAISTVNTCTGNIKTCVDDICNSFTGWPSEWQGPAGGAFGSLLFPFTATSQGLVSMLEDMVTRMRQTYRNYQETEALNAQILSESAVIQAQINHVNAQEAKLTAQYSEYTSQVDAYNGQFNSFMAGIRDEERRGVSPATINEQIAAEKVLIGNEDTKLKDELRVMKAESADIKTETATINREIAAEKKQVGTLNTLISSGP